MADETKPNDNPAATATEPKAAEEQPAVTEPAPTDGAGEDGKEEAKDKLHQQVLIQEVGPCRKHIKVTVERDDVDKLLDEKYKELVGDSWVPGFRKGKAPREIVIRRYKKDVQDQVKSQLLLASLEQLAEDNDIAPLSPPNINPDRLLIPDKGPFVYEFEVEVRPQFDLPDYKGLKLRRPVRTFADADVDREMKRILGSFGQMVPKDGPAELDDFLTVDMTTRLGDRVIGEIKETTLRVDDTLTFKDGVAAKFGQQMVGVKAGDTRTVDIRMTDAVADETLKGKTVQATLEVKDVKTQRLPELSHEFMHDQLGVHSEDQLRERVRTLLERRMQYAQRQSAREQVLELIAGSMNWELPHDLLMRQARRAANRRILEMREAGMSEEEIKSRQRLLERDVLNSTASSLKEHFVLQKIAEVEKLELDDEEIDAEIEAIADQIGESPRRVRAQYEREDMLETLAAQLIERKALNLVLDNAEYTDVPMEQEAGMSASEAQAVPGEVKDPTAAPPEPEQPEEPEAKESEAEAKE
jgi:trigger factor